MRKKLLTLALAAVMAVSSAALAGCGKKDDTDVQKEVFTPTFMYFVSPSDENYDEAMAVVEELKSEYGDKVKFDIHNIEETPEDKENFPVDGQTPALIMLNTKNDISSFQFQCVDKESLKKDIDTALAAE